MCTISGVTLYFGLLVTELRPNNTRKFEIFYVSAIESPTCLFCLIAKVWRPNLTQFDFIDVMSDDLSQRANSKLRKQTT